MFTSHYVGHAPLNNTPILRTVTFRLDIGHWSLVIGHWSLVIGH
ncbi:hypothetical protein DES53_11580 [Roseimicrobium gellanilyticum]|uniref:Uncharacterized protein n=1 Tax=Roseimicrobium gellanilyticum TaxID=748857 RepID=A0A366H4V0_9BACT|nr:hypothetical protein DES53_11580 [Roseimicrobium gellanilyticum]